MKEGRLALLLLLIALVALAGGNAVAVNTFTLFDDGDALYNNGIYDLGGSGRPAAAATPTGAPYSGQEYLTIWGDTLFGQHRDSNRVAAFVRGDVGLDNSQDWWVQFDVTNDLLNTGMAIRIWLSDFRFEYTHLNSGSLVQDNHMTFSFWYGHQKEYDNAQGGMGIEALLKDPAGGAPLRLPINTVRLDPDPDFTSLRGGHNDVVVQWFANAQLYQWTVSNKNGIYQVNQPASALSISPATTYVTAGTIDPGYWMASAWTIWNISYGQGRLYPPPFAIELGGGGTATVGGSPAADEAEYFGNPELDGVAMEASDASFVKTRLLTDSAWTVRGCCENAGVGTTYSHQIMTSAWSGQPETYSGIPSTLMLQILEAANGEVSFAYVNTTGNLLTWNQTAKAWQAGSNVLDITLDGGGNDEWWICYDGTDYWLSVSNGYDVRTTTVTAADVRGAPSDCYFAAGRPWTTGWNQTADFAIKSLELLPYFSEPPLSTGPFIVELAGNATATIDGSPVADEDTYDGLTELAILGPNAGTDAGFIKTPPVGRHPWTVTVGFWIAPEREWADGLAFAAEVKDPLWSGQPDVFAAWPGNNKMMVRAEDSADSALAAYFTPAGPARYWEITNWLSGVWVSYEALMELYFAGWYQDSIAIGYNGVNYFFRASYGGDTRLGAAPGNTAGDVRYKTEGSYVAIGDMYTNRDKCDFIITSARLLPYFDTSLFVGSYSGYTYPAVEKISDAEQRRNGKHLMMRNDVVSQNSTGVYFAQEKDRSAGIAVLSSAPASLVTPGKIRHIAGVIGDQNGERVIREAVSSSASGGSTTAPKPLEVTGRSLGGGAVGKVRGVELGTGLNNLGLYVKTTGRVTYVAPDKSYFLLDDGSAIADDPAGLGVKVIGPTVMTTPPALNSYIAVKGAARPYIRPDGLLGREVMFSNQANDIRLLAGP